MEVVLLMTAQPASSSDSGLFTAHEREINEAVFAQVRSGELQWALYRGYFMAVPAGDGAAR